MTSVELLHRSVRFEPELDLESVDELLGKDIMQAALGKFREAARCSALIQDSHGWCFYVHADDGRKYFKAFLDKGILRWDLDCPLASLQLAEEPTKPLGGLEAPFLLYP